MSKSFYAIIRSPAITEKATLGFRHNQVVFNVADHATKPQIKAAVEKLFGVKVKSVNTLVRKGKFKRLKGRKSTQSDVKKAYVTLAEGHRLDVTTGSDRARTQGQPWHSRHTNPTSSRPPPSGAGRPRPTSMEGKPVKSLTAGRSKSGGRGNPGRITQRRKGGGHKQAYRLVDFKRAQIRRSGDGRAARIRSQPHRLHRSHQIRRRRARLHSGPAASDGRR